MTSRTHQIEFATGAFASAPFFTTLSQYQFAPIVPNGQKQALTFPVLAANGKGSFTSYPPEHDDDDDEELLHTYQSFSEEPVTALSIDTRQSGQWFLCIEVPIASVDNPTLLALDYMIKYATTCDDGNSTVQTDIILTTETLPTGVLHRDEELHSVYGNRKGYSPRMVKHEAALRLSSTLSVKCNGATEHWNHYLDTQHVTPGVRVVDEDCHLYLVFHVFEYPTTRTVRNLSVEVSATWQKEEVERKAIEEAERKAREQAEKEAKAEAERRARHEEEKQARREEKEERAREEAERQEARQARDEERRARQEEKQAREEEKKAREAERQARLEEKIAREEERLEREEAKLARQATSIAFAPDTADAKLTKHIVESLERFNLEPCPTGKEWVKTSAGYRCTGGHHSITFAQLGMK